MEHLSAATRSIRKNVPAAARRVSQRAARRDAALQVFVFDGDNFIGTELFGVEVPVIVGRSRDAQLVLNSDVVSREHCQLIVRGESVWVEDLQSGNGTRVGASRIRGQAPLAPNDSLHVGRFTLKVRCLVAPGPRPLEPADTMITTRIEGSLDGAGAEAQCGVGIAPPELFIGARRRSTDEAAAQPLTPLSEDTATELSKEHEAPTPRLPSVLDPEVEDRLKDLDALLASLDDRAGRAASEVPYREKSNFPTTSEIDVDDAIAKTPLREPRISMNTGEFARDLASRLALDGRLLEKTPRRMKLVDPVPRQRYDDGPATEQMDDVLPTPAEPQILQVPGHNAPLPPNRGHITRHKGNSRRVDHSGHQARLLTPHSQRISVEPVQRRVQRSESSQLHREVFSGVAPSTKRRPPPLPPSTGQAPQLPRRPATEAKVKDRIDGFSPPPVKKPRPSTSHKYDGVEVAARVDGRLVDIAVLRSAGEQYVLGHHTPQGALAPAITHLGLRLLRINPDRTVDLVFPSDVNGHLVRGPTTVTFQQLTEGRKYSCLRLENRDVATVMLGHGKRAVSYHVRFLHRPKSLMRSLQRRDP